MIFLNFRHQLVMKNFGKKTEGKWIQDVQQDFKAVGLQISDSGNRDKINSLLMSHKCLAETTRRRAVEISDDL